MMKKLFYILCLWLCVACNQYATKSDNAVAKEAVEEEVVVDKDGLLDTDFNTNETSTNFSLDDMNAEIEEKLQANYEAILLLTKHPEFREAIKEQLAASSKFDMMLSDSIQHIKIKELKFVGSATSRNDSVSVQKLNYTTVINSKYTQKDSVLVIVKRSIIDIDDTKKVNTSFTFEKLY